MIRKHQIPDITRPLSTNVRKYDKRRREMLRSMRYQDVRNIPGRRTYKDVARKIQFKLSLLGFFGIVIPYSSSWVVM